MLYNIIIIIKRKDMEVITVYFKEYFLLDSEKCHTNISQDNGTTDDESDFGRRDAKQDC
jgi:hypothetical protein